MRNSKSVGFGYGYHVGEQLKDSPPQKFTRYRSNAPAFFHGVQQKSAAGSASADNLPACLPHRLRKDNLIFETFGILCHIPYYEKERSCTINVVRCFWIREAVAISGIFSP